MMRCLPAAGHSLDPRIVLRGIFRRIQSGCGGRIDLPYDRMLFTNSGTSALCTALEAIRGLSPAREVVIPAYTCPSVAAAIIRTGLNPVLCDLEADRFTMDKKMLAALINDGTLAVIAVHLFGISENISAIRDLPGGQNIIIIEDATQSTGNRASGEERPSGAIGDIGILSFGRGKPLSILSGGAIVPCNPEYDAVLTKTWSDLPQRSGWLPALRYRFLLLAYSVLFHPRLFWLPRSLPWLRLGETIFTLQFPVEKAGNTVMSTLASVTPRFRNLRCIRTQIETAYRSELEGCRGLVMPPVLDPDENLLRFPLLFESGVRRDEALRELERGGLGATGMYPAPLHRLPGLESFFQGARDLQRSESIAGRILTLPLHDRVQPSDISRIGGIVRSICGVVRNQERTDVR